MSLCEVPAPSKELVDKYEAMKATFYKRLINAYGKLQGVVGEHEHGQNVRAYAETLKDKPELQAAIKVARWGFAEISIIPLKSLKV